MQAKEAIELVADLGETCYLLQAVSLEKVQGCDVLRVDAGEHDMFAGRAGILYELIEEQRSDSFAMRLKREVDGRLDGETVSGPCAKVAEAANRSIIDHNEHGVALLEAAESPGAGCGVAYPVILG